MLHMLHYSHNINYSKDGGSIDGAIDYNVSAFELEFMRIAQALSLYGERAYPWKRVLAAIHKTVDKRFKIITEEHIFQWLQDEQRDTELISKLVRLYQLYSTYRRDILLAHGADENNRRFINVFYPHLGQLLGFYYPCADNCLHKYSVDFSNIIKSEWESIKKKLKENATDFAQIIDLTLFQYQKGYIMKYKHGTVVAQPRRRYYYRGKSAFYPTAKASMFRCCKNENDILSILLTRMRLIEFRKFLGQFEIVNDWKYGNVIFDALAQHYDLTSSYIDITNDLCVALFFCLL